MKQILLLAVTVGLVAFAATPAIGGGPGAPKFVTGTSVGTTTSDPYTFAPLVYSHSEGVLNAKQPWGKLSYVRDAFQDWSGQSYPSNPCGVIAQSSFTTYFDVNNNANSFYTQMSGTVCELPVRNSNPLDFNNTRYTSTLVETVVSGSGQGRFAGITGTLNTTGTSTGPSPPTGVYTDSFKTTGTLTFAP